MSDNNKELIKQLKALNESIDVPAKVTAVSIGKETIFKGKDKKEEKIEILDKLGLPRNIIAIIIGSTPESVSSFRTLKKPKSTAAEKIKAPEKVEEKNDEQGTV